MEILNRINTFHKTTLGYVIFGVIEAVLLYIFMSIAFDTASMWAYLAAIILLFGVLYNFYNLVRKAIQK